MIRIEESYRIRSYSSDRCMVRGGTFLLHMTISLLRTKPWSNFSLRKPSLRLGALHTHSASVQDEHRFNWACHGWGFLQHGASAKKNDQPHVPHLSLSII